MTTFQKTLYLHVGGQKTGSTELQRFFVDNIDWLRTKGIIYPFTGLHYRGQYRLSWQSREYVETFTNKYTQPLETEQYWEILACDDDLQNNSFLVSAEGFFLDFIPKNNNKHITFIKRLFPNHVVKVIVYLREQYAMLSSIRNEYLKLGYLEHNICEVSKADYFASQINTGLCDYLEWLNNIEKVIPKKDILVRLYDRKSLIRNDIVEDFLAVIGLRHSGETKRQTQDANPRISSPYLESVFFELGGLLNDIPHRSRNRLYRSLLSALSDEKINNENITRDSSASLPSFENDNEILRAKYFPELPHLFLPTEVDKSSDNAQTNYDPWPSIAAKCLAKIWRYSEEQQKKLLLENIRLSNALNASTQEPNIDAATSQNSIELEELFFLKNLANIKYQLSLNNSHRIALFGYNDISIAIMRQLDAQKVAVKFFIDQKAAYGDLVGAKSSIPAFVLNDADLTQVDTILLCTESSTASMREDLLRRDYSGLILPYCN